MAKIGNFRGHPVVDPTGAKIGKLDDYYKDDVTGRPLWLKVKTRWLGRRNIFVALRGAKPIGDKVVVAFDEDFVKHSPVVDHDGPLSAQEDAQLQQYYGDPA